MTAPSDDRSAAMTRCSGCGTESVRVVRPTLAAGIVFGRCDICRKSTMQRLLRVDPLRAVGPPAPEESIAAGMAGSAAAAARWTAAQEATVDSAIRGAAERSPEITADHVWAVLPETFPVTKGLGSRLVAARRAGIIAPTDRVTTSQRKGVHGHGQRLAVWRSLVYRPVERSATVDGPRASEPAVGEEEVPRG